MIVPRAYLEQHIMLMKSTVENKLSELVFNLDEVGSSDWEDRKPKNVIVPRLVSPDDVYHAVSRRYRHITLLACVSAAGDALTPMIIVGSNVPDSIWRHGLREDEDVMIRTRQPAYIDESLFYEYITSVFIPYVLNLRQKPEFAAEKAVLLMDSASPHVSERVLRVLGQNDIVAIVFPAHTTNIFQALDLVFFAALKKMNKTATGEFEDHSIREQITKLVQSYEQTATSATIRGSFRKA